ncbi:O-antigen ligase family protein [Comamonas terrigena]|uniref:O-antigen ligase family protein n=1 Tax=Comamonas terrigena TaxID=32013 RepID=UPI00244D6625|nr:O-antigen ligase family protein [Comamonas terrigena]MDH1701130.1 O-antigen ligase family protein [Comamonas terrigena]
MSLTPPQPIPDCEHNASTSGHLPAMALFMWLLPQFAIPASAAYRPPAASLFLLLWAFFALMQPLVLRLWLRDPGALRQWVVVFFVYCLASALYGYMHLDGMGKLTLHLTTGGVAYSRVVLERLLQVMLVLVAFEVVRHTRHPIRQLMRWWLQGLTVAVVLHALTYVITADPLLQRAGTFNEGNLAGMYYLLSIFVALEYRRAAPSRAANCYLLLALIGVVLSQSSASLVLLAMLLSTYYVFSARTRSRLLLRSLTVFIAAPALAIGLVLAGLDFGIHEKLFEEEITPASFSRIDRLESINAALQLFENAPIFGQGLQTYGFLSNELLSGPLLTIYDESYRRIANNIYAELASEMGLVGLVLFCGFLLSLIRLAWKRTGAGRRHWLLGLTGVLLYWNAFPTYTVVFIWVFFGLVLKSASPRKASSPPLQGPALPPATLATTTPP